MANNLPRMTMFAIISSIEIDLRVFIEHELLNDSSLKDLITESVFQKARHRAEQDLSFNIPKITDEVLLEYLDFADYFEAIINRNKNKLSENLLMFTLKSHSALKEVTPIRNRVMHSRPLLIGDLATVVNAAEFLLKGFQQKFFNLKNVYGKLKDEPGYVLNLDLNDKAVSERISHNLPVPDFDETGFIGRKQDCQEVRRKILGAYPVTTIVGVGGLGKTALALKIAYDLLDDDECPFEAIVWMSSKEKFLGVDEIQTIENAITTSVGVFDSIEKELGASSYSEIREYMEEFKILLILDNLETVLDNRLIEFLSDLPVGSKVLITSRVGLGRVDLPYKLLPLDANESLSLLRELARIRSNKLLITAKNGTLKGYVQKMKSNPGFIKWFVNAVCAGKRPEVVLDRPKLFLEFCMQDVYEHLSDNSKGILNVMMSITSTHAASMLQYFTGLDYEDVEQAIIQLLSFNMIEMESKDRTTVYKLTEIPSFYLKHRHAPSEEYRKQINKKNQEIISQTEGLDKELKQNPYNFNNICVSTSALRVVAKYLRDVLKSLKTSNYEEAYNLLQNAKSVEPGYFEVHRIEAMYHMSKKDLINARMSYERAIELNPSYAPLRSWYGGFLLRECNELDEAIEQFKKCKEFDKKSLAGDLEIARCLIYKKDFNRAYDILQDIEGKAVKENHFKFKLSSLRLVYYRRKAEFLMEQKEHVKAYECYKDLISYFEKLPLTYQDDRNKKEIKSAFMGMNRVVAFLYGVNNLPEEVMNARRRFENFLDSLTPVRKAANDVEGRKTGTVKHIQSGKNYGFITDLEGRDFFFHVSNLTGGDFNSLKPNSTQVTFLLGENKQGVCAEDIRVCS